MKPKKTGKYSLKRRSHQIGTIERKCLRCDDVFKARRRKIQGQWRLLDRICRKCKKLYVERFGEDYQSLPFAINVGQGFNDKI